jgi:hypothetical protein
MKNRGRQSDKFKIQNVSDLFAGLLLYKVCT